MIQQDHITFDGVKAWLVPTNGVMLYRMRQFDRPCDTCIGTGFIEWWSSVIQQNNPCPDCIDGRHTFDIEVGTFTVFDAEDGERAIRYEPRIHRVSIVPGMVLPIVTLDQSDGNNEANIMWDEVTDDFIYYPAGWYDDSDLDTEQTITLPPAAKPGMWAAQLKVH